jgi:hydrogenase nickel incorporation protein HypA/HybF
MHEFSITSSLVDAVLDLARQKGSSRVLEVHLRIGKLRALSIDQVMFSYDVLAKGTILDGSKLFITETPGTVRCVACGYHAELEMDFHFGISPLACPQCAAALTIEGGDECVITRVLMLQPSEEKRDVH